MFNFLSHFASKQTNMNAGKNITSLVEVKMNIVSVEQHIFSQSIKNMLTSII